MSAANCSHRPASPVSPPSLRAAVVAVVAVVASAHLGGAIASTAGAAVPDRGAATAGPLDEAHTQRPGEQQTDHTVVQRIARLEAGIEQVRVELDNAINPLRVLIADRGQDLRAMQARLSALEEQLALANERLAELGQRLEQLVAAAAGSGGTAPSTTSPMPPPGGEVGVAGPRAARPEAGPTAPSDTQQLYSRAYTDFLRENYDLAIAGFEEYLQRFPEDPQADNALYWIGECRLARGDHRGAIAAFREVAERYPRGDAVPDAMFKVALALRDVGDDAGASAQMRRLIRAHSSSAPARLACNQLQRTEEDLPPECGPGTSPGRM